MADSGVRSRCESSGAISRGSAWEAARRDARSLTDSASAMTREASPLRSASLVPLLSPDTQGLQLQLSF